MFKLHQEILNNYKNKQEKSYLSDFKILEEMNIGKINSDYNLQRLSDTENKFSLINNDSILLYPRNDGFPTLAMKFCYENFEVINNQKAFHQIKNIDHILIQIARIMNESLDSDIVIEPYNSFLLKLTDPIKPNYKGHAKLLIVDNFKIDDRINQKEIKNYFENSFLDIFMGLNFGVNIERSTTLRDELLVYTQRLIDNGTRKVYNYNVIHNVCYNEYIRHFDFPFTNRQMCDVINKHKFDFEF